MVNCARDLALTEFCFLLPPHQNKFHSRMLLQSASPRHACTYMPQNAVGYGCRISLSCQSRIVVGGGHLGRVPCGALHWLRVGCRVCLGTAPSPRSGARHCVKGPSGRPLRKPILANGSLQEGASSCKILELPGSQVSWLNIFLLPV